MLNFSVIAVIASFAYALESIFGFGGTIIFLGVSGLLYDFNSLLKLAVFVAISSGLAVLIILQTCIMETSHSDINLYDSRGIVGNLFNNIP